MNDIERLSDLEKAKRISINQKNDHALREFARQCVCLDEINKLAREKITKGTKSDEVEVALALQLHLRYKLKLSIITDGLVFNKYSRLTKSDIKNAENRL